MNGTEAYSRLHPKTTYESCRMASSRLISKDNIKAEISKRLDEQAMSKSEIIARLAAMARATAFKFIRITDDGFCYFNFSDPEAEQYFYLIKKIKTKRTRRIEGKGREAEVWEDEWVEVELHDAKGALETLGRYHRLEQPEPEETKARTQCIISADIIGKEYFDALRAINSGLYDEFLLEGGRGSLKSSFVSLAVIYLLVNNPNMHGLVMRQIADTMRDSVYNQLLWAESMLGLQDSFKNTTSPMEITYLPTKQKIHFRGGDDPGKIKSITPLFGYIGINWFEELDQFRGPEAVRKIEQSSMRGGDVVYNFKTYNPPPTQMNWVNKYAKQKKERQYHHRSNYLNTPPEWLGRAWLEEAEHLKEVNPRAYAHEYMGEVTGLGGMVFENLTIRKITDEEIAQFDHVSQGIDWGYFPDPFAWGKSHLDMNRRKLYIFDEAELFRYGNMESWNYLVENKGVSQGDVIIADSAEPKSVSDYRSYGANCIGAEKGAGSIDYSMKWLQSLSEIIIDPERCPRHEAEFTEYEYEKDKDGEYITSYPDENNHFIDEIRYRTNPIWRKRGK
jgi:PBSX family phage terminase large subunit